MFVLHKYKNAVHNACMVTFHFRHCRVIHSCPAFAEANRTRAQSDVSCISTRTSCSSESSIQI